jgi:hypothetical protein
MHVLKLAPHQREYHVYAIAKEGSSNKTGGSVAWKSLPFADRIKWLDWAETQYDAGRRAK